MTCKPGAVVLGIVFTIVCFVGHVFLFGSVSFDRLVHSNANSLYWYQSIIGVILFAFPCLALAHFMCASNFEAIVLVALGVSILYSIPMASMQYYIFTKCSNGYMSQWDLGNLIVHMIILLILSAVIGATMISKYKFYKSFKDFKDELGFALVHIFYFCTVIIYCAIAITTLSKAKLHSTYNPQYFNVSILALPRSLTPSHPLTDYPIGHQLSEMGEEVADYVVVPTVLQIMRSRHERVEVHTSCDSDGDCTTTTHTLRIFHTALTCSKLLPRSRPPSCLKNLTIVFEHYVKEFGGISYKACGYNNPDIFEEDWTLRFLKVHDRNGSKGVLVTTPWQEVNNCGESEIKRDKDIWCPGIASSLSVTAVVIITLFHLLITLL